jgi:hypothetical protein
MIDYYFEFEPDTEIMHEPTHYAILRGFHPDDATLGLKIVHNTCYKLAVRVWVENANGITLVREHDRDCHQKCDPRVLTWIKLQAREL